MLEEVLDCFGQIVPQYHHKNLEEIELLLKTFKISIYLIDSQFHSDHFPRLFSRLEFDFEDEYFALND